MSYVSIRHHGFVSDNGGYNGAFSWCRNDADRRFWHVCGYGPFTKDGTAVTDDFGNLVEVRP